MKFVAVTAFSPQAVGELCYKMMDAQPEAERPKAWAILTEDDENGERPPGVRQAGRNGLAFSIYRRHQPRWMRLRT